MITGKLLNELFDIKAQHALYREDGKWYHPLKKFPGVLFDKSGYVIFSSQTEYQKNPKLKHTKDLHIDGGISSMKEYTSFTSSQQKVYNKELKKHK